MTRRSALFQYLLTSAVDVIFCIEPFKSVYLPDLMGNPMAVLLYVALRVVAEGLELRT